MTNANDDFDWFKWAGIEPREFDKLVAEARKEGIPVFDGDSAEQLFNRILAHKTFKNNQSTLLMNKILTGITFASMSITLAATFLA